MVLLHQNLIPVVLLPLRVHGGWAKCHWIVRRGAPIVDLSKLNMRDNVWECQLKQKAASVEQRSVKTLSLSKTKVKEKEKENC